MDYTSRIKSVARWGSRDGSRVGVYRSGDADPRRARDTLYSSLRVTDGSGRAVDEIRCRGAVTEA
jgi:hypothetical protein